LKGKTLGPLERYRWQGVFLLAEFILVLICSSSFALEVPPRPEGRVTDQTRTLSPGESAALERRLSSFEQETTNQIAVLLIPSLEGDSLEDYSIRLAEKWKIGQKGKNNGAILLIVKDDRKIRIEVGYGLEGALPDALAGAIIRNEIAPRFKAGQFYQGIEAGIDAIMAATKGEYKARPEKKRGSLLASWLPFLILLVFFGFFALAASQARRRHYHSGGSGGWASGGGFFGGGSSWGDSGGGFSGGGGDFGGGGASGSW
jgi:uncharacterized protein